MKHSLEKTEKIRDLIWKMEKSMKKHDLSGKDLLWTLGYLPQFVRESDVQKMREAQAFIADPSFTVVQYFFGKLRVGSSEQR